MRTWLRSPVCLPHRQLLNSFRSHLPRLEQWGFHLLAGAPDPEHGNELVASRIGELVSGLRAAYDFVLLDLGRSLSRISLPLIEHADLIVHGARRGHRARLH